MFLVSLSLHCASCGASVVIIDATPSYELGAEFSRGHCHSLGRLNHKNSITGLEPRKLALICINVCSSRMPRLILQLTLLSLLCLTTALNVTVASNGTAAACQELERLFRDFNVLSSETNYTSLSTENWYASRLFRLRVRQS